jgi:hypothetical protein
MRAEGIQRIIGPNRDAIVVENGKRRGSAA